MRRFIVMRVIKIADNRLNILLLNHITSKLLEKKECSDQSSRNNVESTSHVSEVQGPVLSYLFSSHKLLSDFLFY